MAEAYLFFNNSCILASEVLFSIDEDNLNQLPQSVSQGFYCVVLVNQTLWKIQLFSNVLKLTNQIIMNFPGK